MRRSIILLLAIVVATASVPAMAVPVVGGTTRIDFTGFVINGVFFAPTGSATSPTGFGLEFPITGGDLDENLSGTIRHDGSGVRLTDFGSILNLDNFVIDTVSSQVFADANLNGIDLGTGLSVFTFDLGSVTVAQLTDLTNPALALILTPTAAEITPSGFGLAGVSVGLAATAPQLATAAVPEPATWAMLLLGMGSVGTIMRVRQRRGAITA